MPSLFLGRFPLDYFSRRTPPWRPLCSRPQLKQAPVSRPGAALLGMCPTRQQRIDLGAHSLDVRRLPVYPSAFGTEGKSLLAGEDERRNTPRDEIAIDRLQEPVTRGAPGQGVGTRVEGPGAQDFTELVACRIGAQVDDIAGGPEPFVASDNRARFGAGAPQ